MKHCHIIIAAFLLALCAFAFPTEGNCQDPAAPQPVVQYQTAQPVVQQPVVQYQQAQPVVQYPAGQPVVVQTTVQYPGAQPYTQPVQQIAPPSDHVAGRVLTDLGFNLLYNLVTAGIGVGLIVDGVQRDASVGEIVAGALFMEVGFFVDPALAVMTSHAIWGGQGSMGWTWLGTLLGWVGALGIGSLFYLSDDNTTFYSIGASLTFLLPITGAILGYELSNKANRESTYGAASSVTIYPAFQFSPERKTIGVGLQF